MKQKGLLPAGPARFDFTRSLMKAAPAGFFAACILFLFSFVPALSFITYEPVFFSGVDRCVNIPNVSLMIAGLFAALAQFKFLASVRMTSVVFSCGLSRARLYGNRCAAGTISLFVGVFLPLTATFCVHFIARGFHIDTLETYLFFLISAFAFVCIGYCAGILGAILTGTTAQAAVSAAALVCLPSVLMLYVYICVCVFLRGYDFADNLLEHPFYAGIYFLNPYYLLRGTTDPSVVLSNVWSDQANASEGISLSLYAPFIGWVLFCALLAAALYPLFLKRKAEISGRFHSSKTASVLVFGFITVAVGTACTAAGALFILSDLLDEDDPFYKGVSLAVMLISALLVLVICLRIQRKNRQKPRRMLKTVSPVLLLAIVPLFCLTGGFSYAKRTPAIGDVQSVSIDGLLLPVDTILYESREEDLMERFFTGGFVSDGDKQRIFTLQKLLAKVSRDSGVKVTIKYILKDKSVIYRSYYSCTDEALKAYAGLFDSDAAEKYLYEQLGDRSAWLSHTETQALDNPETGDYEYLLRARHIIFLNYSPSRSVALRPANNRVSTVITDALTEESYYKLMNCYASDLVGLSADEYYTPDTPPAGVLSIESSGRDPVREERRIVRNFYITASMKKTLDCIKTLGLDGALAAETPITKIELYTCPKGAFIEQNPDPTDEELALITKNNKYIKTVTDPVEIQRLSEKMYPYYLTVGQEYNYAFVTYEDSGVMVFVVKE